MIPSIRDFATGWGIKPQTISDTKDVLQNFLDVILVHPLLRCDDLVYAFLHPIQQEGKTYDEFNKKLKSSMEIEKPTEVKNIKNVDGIAKISLSTELNTNVEMLTKSSFKLKQLYNTYFRRESLI